MNTLDPPAPPNDGDPPRDPILSLEEQKLVHEILSLREGRELTRAEIRKSNLERDKFQQELGRSMLGRLGERVLIGIPLMTALLVAFASVVALIWNHRQDVSKEEADEFHRIVTDFSATGSSIRAGAASQLGYIACCGENSARRPYARALLVSAAGIEPGFNVRHDIQFALERVGSDVLVDVGTRRSELERELSTAFGRGKKPKCDSFKTDLANIRTLQEGLLLLARVTSDLQHRPLDLKEASFRCSMFLKVNFSGADMRRVILWQADVTSSNLQNADLSNAQLDGTDLTEADITGTRFCDASGLRVSSVRAAKSWQTAYYSRHFARLLRRRTKQQVKVCQ